MSLPTFNFEKELWQKGYLIIGIDEVGRGALAGPLVVAGVVFPNFYQKGKPSFFIKKIESFGINDSKKLSDKKRKRLSEVIKKECLAWAIFKVSVPYINKKGITAAFRKGVKEVVGKLTKKVSEKLSNEMIKKQERNPKDQTTRLPNYFLLVDGFYVKHLRGWRLKNQKAVVDGDEKSISIASASIIAKVFRDQLMVHLAKKYPKYHWQKNKGYGTKEHIKALKEYGKTKFHRNLYLRKIIGAV